MPIMAPNGAMIGYVHRLLVSHKAGNKRGTLFQHHDPGLLSPAGEDGEPV